jgi:uncharacterized protein DUF4124
LRLTAIITVILITLLAGSALAEVYRYTDSSGELHFVDDIAKGPKKYRKQLENPNPMAEGMPNSRFFLFSFYDDASAVFPVHPG